MIKSLTGKSSESHNNDIRHLEQNYLSSLSTSSDRRQNKQILVVDDNPDSAFTLRAALENNDATIQVHSYDNPVNDLFDFKPNCYDLLLIDVNMPLMDGFDYVKNYYRKISMLRYVL